MKKLLLGLETLTLLGLATPVYAETLTIPPPANVPTFPIGNVISAVVGVLLLVSAILAFLYLIIGGIRWITSGGDKEQTTAARSQLTAALIGLVIVFSAWAILRVVGTFFNLPDLLQLDIPTIQPGGAGGI